MITETEVHRTMRQLIRDNPTATNPTGGMSKLGQCFYTSPVDPNHHCVVGEWLVDSGFPAPSAEVYDSARWVLTRDRRYQAKFTLGAVEALNAYQNVADAAAVLGLTWGEAFAPCLQAGLPLAVRYRDLVRSQ